MTSLESIAFGEVVQTNLDNSVIQAWKLDCTAIFGELVLISSETTDYLGIVYQVSSEPIDSTRTIVPFEQTASQLAQEQPHIFHFIKTTATCILLGEKEKEANSFHFSHITNPPPLHTFAYKSPDALYTNFLNDTTGISHLMRIAESVKKTDALCLALIGHAAKKKLLTETITHLIALELTEHINDDYLRLQSVCQRIETIEKTKNNS